MQPLNTEQINRLKKQASICSVLLAIILIIIKSIGVIYSGSLSVLSSMVDSMGDLVASMVTFTAVRFSAKPASSSHRYGFGKAEALSALIQSAFIGGSGVFIIYDGISRIIHPHPQIKSQSAIIIMIISLILTFALIAFQKYVAKKTGSRAIKADSAHYSVDVITNISIIFTLIAINLFHINWFDTVAAFFVASYLLWSSYHLVLDSLTMIMDKELGDDIRENIKKIVLSCDHIQGIHDLRTRDLGSSYIFELHLELDGNLSLNQAHQYTDNVETELLKTYPGTQIIIHQDPAGLHENRLDYEIDGHCDIKNK